MKPSPPKPYASTPAAAPRVLREEHIEYVFVGKLQELKYEYRSDWI